MLFQQRKAAQYCHEQVVEIVSDLTGQFADGIHFCAS